MERARLTESEVRQMWAKCDETAHLLKPENKAEHDRVMARLREQGRVT
jgi:hypothetical protein